MTDSPRRPDLGRGKPHPPSYPGYTDPAYANQAPYGTTYQPPRDAGSHSTVFGVPAVRHGLRPVRDRDVRLPLSAGRCTTRATATRRAVSAVAVGAGGSVGARRAWPRRRPGRRQHLRRTDRRCATTVCGAHLHHPLDTSNHHAEVGAHDDPTVAVAVPAPRRIPHPRRAHRAHRAGETETVDYNVDGTGRAISITYVDTGGVLQTEFNVMLPVEQAGRAGQARRLVRERQHHQLRPRTDVLDHRRGGCRRAPHRVGAHDLRGAGLGQVATRCPHQKHREQPQRQNGADSAQPSPIRSEHRDERRERTQARGRTRPARWSCRARTPRPPCPRRTSAASASAPTTA